jgi:hypothetical protein
MLTLALAAALVTLASYNAGKFAFKKDDQQERMAEHLLQLSNVLSSYGLKDIPKAMQLVAIKDYSGAIEIVKFYVQLVQRDPASVVAEFDKVYENVKAVKEAKAAAEKAAATVKAAA